MSEERLQEIKDSIEFQYTLAKAKGHENALLFTNEEEELVEEVERLNNIIYEFNKLIENEINESKLEEDYDRVDAMEYCLATLRELKGSDKE